MFIVSGAPSICIYRLDDISSVVNTTLEIMKCPRWNSVSTNVLIESRHSFISGRPTIKSMESFPNFVQAFSVSQDPIIFLNRNNLLLAFYAALNVLHYLPFVMSAMVAAQS